MKRAYRERTMGRQEEKLMEARKRRQKGNIARLQNLQLRECKKTQVEKRSRVEEDISRGSIFCLCWWLRVRMLDGQASRREHTKGGNN